MSDLNGPVQIGMCNGLRDLDHPEHRQVHVIELNAETNDFRHGVFLTRVSRENSH